MDIEAIDKTNDDDAPSNEYDGPLAPRPRENGNSVRRGVRMSRDCVSSACQSRRESVDKLRRSTEDFTNNDTRTRGSKQVSDEGDEKLDKENSVGANKFRCEGCESYIHEDAMVFILKNEKAVCTSCALKGVKQSKKPRAMSQMLVQAEINEVLEIRDAKQVATSVMRAGDYTKKLSKDGASVRIVNDFEIKCDHEDADVNENKVMAPVIVPRMRDMNSSGRLPRRLGDDDSSKRREVRRASEPLSQVNRPTFDNRLVTTSVIALSDTV